MASDSTPSGRRSRSKAAEKGKTPGRQPVLAWGEVSVTICIDPDNKQYVRASFGHERHADNDSRAALLRAADEIDELNEEVLEKAVKKYGRLARDYQQSIIEEDEDEEDTPAKRARKKLRDRR